MFEKLKDIIDKAHSTFENNKEDCNQLINYVNYDIDRTHDTTISNISFSQLKEFAKILVYGYLLFDEPNAKYINILRSLFAIINVKKIPSFDDIETWNRIITKVKDFRFISEKRYDFKRETLSEDYTQEVQRVMQLKVLISMGCKVIIEKEKLKIIDIKFAIDKLESLIKEIGGITLARNIFCLLSEKSYSNYFERFHLTRLGNFSIQEKPQVPFGYLLNLCVKYPCELKTKKNINKILLEIQNLSVAITTGYYEFQHYDEWTQFLGADDITIKYCTEIALWDSIYSLIQIRPKLSLQITEALYHEIDDPKFLQMIGVGKKDYFIIMNEVLEIAKETKGVIFIYISALKKNLKNIEVQVIKKVLDLNSHLTQANSKYLFPSDFEEVDFQSKSLIKMSETKYLLMDKSWCSPALYESLATPLRSVIDKFDSRIMGPSLEKLVYKWLLERNITSSYGKYKVDSIEGDCDLLIETEKAIILIEVKKKVLTKKAKSGLDIDIFTDLTNSILDSQIQAGKIELILREKGEITLVDKKTNFSKTIKWENRKIERISLSHLDFGGFHDKTILSQFLSALLTRNYDSDSKDLKIIEIINLFKESQKEWILQYNKLSNIDEKKAFPFLDCSFMNLGQLLEVINISTDNDSFYAKLKSNKCITYGTLDFYREFERRNNLN